MIVLLFVFCVRFACGANGVFSLGTTILVSGAVPRLGFNAIQPSETGPEEVIVASTNAANLLRCTLLAPPAPMQQCVTLPAVKGGRTIANVNGGALEPREDVVGTNGFLPTTANRGASNLVTFRQMVDSANVLPTVVATSLTKHQIELVGVVDGDVVGGISTSMNANTKQYVGLPNNAVSHGLYGGDFNHDSYPDVLHFYARSEGGFGAALLLRVPKSIPIEYSSMNDAFQTLGFDLDLNYSFNALQFLPFDSDLDGLLDILLVSGGKAQLYRGQATAGKPLFQKSFEFPFAVDAADVGDIVDEDGIPEIVVVRGETIEVWRRRTGTTGFDTMVDSLATGSPVDNVMLADATRDGRLDLVIGYADGKLQLAPYSAPATAFFRVAVLNLVVMWSYGSEIAASAVGVTKRVPIYQHLTPTYGRNSPPFAKLFQFQNASVRYEVRLTTVGGRNMSLSSIMPIAPYNDVDDVVLDIDYQDALQYSQEEAKVIGGTRYTLPAAQWILFPSSKASFDSLRRAIIVDSTRTAALRIDWNHLPNERLRFIKYFFDFGGLSANVTCNGRLMTQPTNNEFTCNSPTFEIASDFKDSLNLYYRGQTPHSITVSLSLATDARAGWTESATLTFAASASYTPPLTTTRSPTPLPTMPTLSPSPPPSVIVTNKTASSSSPSSSRIATSPTATSSSTKTTSGIRSSTTTAASTQRPRSTSKTAPVTFRTNSATADSSSTLSAQANATTATTAAATATTEQQSVANRSSVEQSHVVGAVVAGVVVLVLLIGIAIYFVIKARRRLNDSASPTPIAQQRENANDAVSPSMRTHEYGDVQAALASYRDGSRANEYALAFPPPASDYDDVTSRLE